MEEQTIIVTTPEVPAKQTTIFYVTDCLYTFDGAKIPGETHGQIHEECDSVIIKIENRRPYMQPEEAQTNKVEIHIDQHLVHLLRRLLDEYAKGQDQSNAEA